LGLDFAARFPDRCLTVRLDGELTDDPRAAFARIFAFVGVPYEEAPVEFVRSNRINSSYRAPTPERDDPWQYWDAEQRAAFREEAGDLMRELGMASEADLAG